MNKNVRKIIRLLCVLLNCFMISQLLVGCNFVKGRFYRRSPYSPDLQCMTKWISEDGRVYFEVDDNGNMRGYISVENANIDISLGSDYGSHLIVYDSNKPTIRYSQEQQCEYLNCDFIKENMFVAKVEEATYLTEGETLVFYKIQNTGDGSLVLSE